MENDDNGQSCGRPIRSFIVWLRISSRRWSPIGSDRGGSAVKIHLHVLNSMIFLRKNIQGCIHPIPNIKTPAFYGPKTIQNMLSCVTSILGTGFFDELSGMSTGVWCSACPTRVLSPSSEDPKNSGFVKVLMGLGHKGWTHKENPSVDIHIGGHWTPQLIATYVYVYVYLYYIRVYTHNLIIFSII